MAMTGIEKIFVNRDRKAEKNIIKIQQRLDELEASQIHDVSKIQNVIELGCGIGGVSAYLAHSKKMNVYGTDFDPQQIEIARQFNPENDRLHFGVEDASHLTCKDSQFDLVVSQNVFHHIPDWKAAVGEIFRVMKPGGYLFWLDLSFQAFLIRITGPFVKNYGLYTFEDIQVEFNKYKFDYVYNKQLSKVPFPHHHLVLQKPGGKGGENQ